MRYQHWFFTVMLVVMVWCLTSTSATAQYVCDNPYHPPVVRYYTPQTSIIGANVLGLRFDFSVPRYRYTYTDQYYRAPQVYLPPTYYRVYPQPYAQPYQRFYR